MTTHIAGIDVTIDGHRMRQLCAWCGYQLIDHDLTLVVVPVGQEGLPRTWPVGSLVRVDGPMSILVESDGPLPEDCCSRLDGR